MTTRELVRRSIGEGGSLIKRLRRMDGDELRFRSSTMLRAATDRAAFALHKPVWQRSTFVSLANRGNDDIDSAIASAQRRDWGAAHLSVMRYVEGGGCAFVLDPRQRTSTVARIQSAFPTAISDAAERGARILSGTFDLLGYRGLSFSNGDGRIDWHLDPVHNRRPPRMFWNRVPYLAPESGDHKIIWELNRHQHWMALGRAYWLTGDSRFRDRFIDELDGWLAANPPLDGMNWASMLELALRSISWIWALHYFADTAAADKTSNERPWTIDMLVALDRQLTLVERNLSRYFSPNTHLLGEALALYVAGRTLPLRNAARWAEVGRTVLVEEIERQINEDGGHVELSTHYHRYTLDFYLLALAVAARTGDPVEPVLASAVSDLATFARAMADDRGTLPAIGDEDGGSLLPFCGRAAADVSDSLQIAALLLERPELAVGSPAEEVVWMTGELPGQPRTEAWPSTALPYSGYYVSRPGGGDHLTIDAGPHGFLNGGHAHADALSIAITVGSRPLIVDPGTGCYTIDPETRDRFRSTALHNTLTLDRRSQSVPAGPFHWRSTARTTALDWQTSDGHDYFEGEHDGYKPAIHRRAMVSRSGCWTVVDRVSADDAVHRADVHWHIHPAWQVTQVNGHGAKAIHTDGTVVWIVGAGDDISFEVLRGSSEQRDLGWCSPVYGAVVPATTIRITSERTAPIHIATVIAASSDVPDVEMIRPGNPADGICVRLRTPVWDGTMVFFAAGD